jgi:enoyl-CoA hydratase
MIDAINDVLMLTHPLDGILQISLNRPEQLNALNHLMLHRLKQVLQEVKQDKSIKGIILTGEGKVFCAGADIKQLAELDSAYAGKDFAAYGQEVFRCLELLGKPSLALVHGLALGGGCELAMSATLRLAAKGAIFGQPEIKLGVIPGFGGTQRLSRLVGKGRALELCLTGRRFSVEEAYQWGLVNEIVPQEDLTRRGFDLLKELIQFSPSALRSIQTVIHQGYDLSLEEALEMEAAHFALCCTTPNKREGVSAFLEKRAAVFQEE